MMIFIWTKCDGHDKAGQKGDNLVHQSCSCWIVCLFVVVAGCKCKFVARSSKLAMDMEEFGFVIVVGHNEQASTA